MQPIAYAYTQFLSRCGELTGGLDNIEHLVTLALLGAAVALALSAGRRWVSAPVFCTGLLASLFVARLPWFLPLMGNPDEPQVLAGARRLLRDLVFWRSVDGTTNGPLNHYFLMFFKLLGLPLDLATARFANVVAFWGAMVFLYLAARLLLPEWAARLSVLPLLAAAMEFRHFDFVQYSSECFPMALTACAVWLLARGHLAGRSRDWLWLGLVAAALPLAKLQTLPITAMLVVAAAASIYGDRKVRGWRALGWLAAGGLLAALPLAAMLAGFGLFYDFYESYIVNNLGYANRPEVVWTPANFTEFVFQTPGMDRYLAGVSAFAGIVLAHALWLKKWRPSAAGWVAIGLAAASIYAALRPGRPVAHFLVFLFVPASLAAAAALEWELRQKRHTMAVAVTFAVLTIAIPALRGVMSDDQIPMAPLVRQPKNLQFPASRRLGQLASVGDTVVVWGWEPSLYVLTGTVPGTRESQTQRQIEPGPQREYYRARFLRDLEADPPKVFVDAVGPNRFNYHDRNADGYESVPQLRQYIDAHYEATDDIQNMRLFVRRDRSAASSGEAVEVPVAWRCGGGAVTDAGGKPWGADAFFFGGNPRVFSQDAQPGLSPIDLAERNCRESCEYRVAVRPGTYVVKLHFIEMEHAAPGARVFDVAVNQTPALHDFDIFREAGGAGRPIVRELRTEARDGGITIGLLPKIREAKINGIEIVAGDR